MKLPKVRDILLPLLVTSRIIGTVPYDFKNNKLIFSKKRMLFNLTFIINYIVITTYIFINAQRGEVFQAKTVHFAIVFESMGGIIITILIFVANTLNYKLFILDIRKLNNIDEGLVQLTQEENLIKTARQIRKYSISLIILVEGLFAIGGSAVTATIRYNHKIFYFVSKAYSLLLAGNLSISFYVVFFMVQTKFKMVNDILEEEIVTSRKIKKHPSFSHKLQIIATLHKNLFQVSESLSSDFSVHLLLRITFGFISFSNHIYILFYLIMFHLQEMEYEVILILSIQLIIHGFDLIYFCKKSTDVCYEANRAKSLVVALTVNMKEERERKMIIQTALEMMRHKAQITVYKIFKIDHQLLYSMCGAIFSYLFVMIQIDSDIQRHQ